MTDRLNEEAIDEQSETWQRYLAQLRERRGERWYQLAQAEGPPNFEEGTKVLVHGIDKQLVFRLAQINPKSGKFTLRPTDKFTRPSARFQEQEILLIKGAEFEVKRADQNKLVVVPVPAEELERPDLYQVGVDNATTGKLFMVIVGETEDQVKENVTLMHRMFELVNTLADGKAAKVEEAQELQHLLGLAQAETSTKDAEAETE